MKALDLKVLRDLKTLRSQTMTTAILVVCGVALLVAAWSAYRSLRSARDTYYLTYAFADVFADLKRAPMSVADRLKAIPGVQQMETRIVVSGLVDAPDQIEPAVGQFISVPSNAQPGLNRLYLRKGRLPARSTEMEVVVHEGFANAHHLKPGDQLTVLIESQKKTVLITGIGISPEYVYALSPVVALPDNKHFGIFWTSRENLEELKDMSGAFNNVVLKLAPGASEGEVKTQVDELLKSYGCLGAYGRDRQISNMFVKDEIAQQRVSAVFNPAVFLLIAAFLIHVIISRLIATQRQQIATLKAVGYLNYEVSLHYLKLVTVMTLTGAVPGLFLGAWLGHLIAGSYQNFFHFPKLEFSLSGSAAGLGIAAGLVPGWIGAYSSIRSSYRMSPAEAMRPPAPAAFHANLLEKTGLQSHLRTKNRMVARNLLLRPWRLFLTVLGMSLALALIVLAGFWSDTLNYLLETQFQRQQREDLSLGFLHPLPPGFLQELKSKKGVVSVEGYRLVPVRLRHGHLSRETTIYGWPSTASMRQRLNREFRESPLAPNALVLSQFFKKTLDLKSGDALWVEILEGRQQTIQLPVAGFAQDLIGNSVAMDIESLWRLLDESPNYNFATIQVDPQYLDSLYVEFKNLPEVSAVNVKMTLYRGFQETIGAMIRLTTWILTGFALAIAIGIIYNSVRVSFAERAWELASLQILGFKRRDVHALLISEVSVQVLLSIAPGCAIGVGLAWLSKQMIHTETYEFPVIIRIGTYAEAILTILLSLLASSVITGRMLAKLSLVEALKARD